MLAHRVLHARLVAPMAAVLMAFPGAVAAAQHGSPRLVARTTTVPEPTKAETIDWLNSKLTPTYVVPLLGYRNRVTVIDCSLSVEEYDLDPRRQLNNFATVPLEYLDLTRFAQDSGSMHVTFRMRDGAKRVHVRSIFREDDFGNGYDGYESSTWIELTDRSLADRLRSGFSHLARLCGAANRAKEPF